MSTSPSVIKVMQRERRQGAQPRRALARDFPARARALPGRLRPRARRRHHDGAGGPRSRRCSRSSTRWRGGCLQAADDRCRRPRAMNARVLDSRTRDDPMDERLVTDLKAAIRTIPDYPKPGIMFRDITTLLGDARAFRRAVDELVQPWAGREDRQGRRHRGARLHPRRRRRASALGRLRADPQEGQAAARDRAHRLFARIRRSTRWRCTRTPSRRARGSILVDDLIATGGTAEAAVQAAAADRRRGRRRLLRHRPAGSRRREEAARQLGVTVRTLVELRGALTTFSGLRERSSRRVSAAG